MPLMIFQPSLFPTQGLPAEYRQIGFGAVVAFKNDGIAKGTSALVSTGDGKANTYYLKTRPQQIIPWPGVVLQTLILHRSLE